MLFPDEMNSYNNYSYMGGDAGFDPLFTQDIKPFIKMETVSPPAAQYQPQQQQQHWQAVGAVNNAGYVDQHTPPPQIIEGLDEYMSLSTGDWFVISKLCWFVCLPHDILIPTVFYLNI